MPYQTDALNFISTLLFEQRSTAIKQKIQIKVQQEAQEKNKTTEALTDKLRSELLNKLREYLQERNSSLLFDAKKFLFGLADLNPNSEVNLNQYFSKTSGDLNSLKHYEQALTAIKQLNDVNDLQTISLKLKAIRKGIYDDEALSTTLTVISRMIDNRVLPKRINGSDIDQEVIRRHKIEQDKFSALIHAEIIKHLDTAYQQAISQKGLAQFINFSSEYNQNQLELHAAQKKYEDIQKNLQSAKNQMDASKHEVEINTPSSCDSCDYGLSCESHRPPDCPECFYYGFCDKHSLSEYAQAKIQYEKDSNTFTQCNAQFSAAKRELEICREKLDRSQILLTDAEKLLSLEEVGLVKLLTQCNSVESRLNLLMTKEQFDSYVQAVQEALHLKYDIPIMEPTLHSSKNQATTASPLANVDPEQDSPSDRKKSSTTMGKLGKQTTGIEFFPSHSSRPSGSNSSSGPSDEKTKNLLHGIRCSLETLGDLDPQAYNFYREQFKPYIGLSEIRLIHQQERQALHKMHEELENNLRFLQEQPGSSLNL